MDLDIVWTQGKCSGDAYFISNNEICFRTGQFIKICSTEEFTEVSIQGPLKNIESICADSELSLIAVKDHSIHVLNYPGFDVLSHWEVNTQSYVMQMCFAGDSYLLTLEGSLNFEITFWNWKTTVKMKCFQHKIPTEDMSSCFMSVHPGFNKIVVFQQLDNLHFYEIEDVLEEVECTKNTIYLPVRGDGTGESFLDEKKIENLTYFDKMLHDSWGIHSELLHQFPLKIFCSDLAEHEVVEFHDYLSKQERLQSSCHCWLPDTRLLVACFDGTILTVTLDFLIKIIRSSSAKEFDRNNYITGMVLNKNGLYVSEKTGNIFFVRDIDSWSLITLISIEESPVRMKFSPDYKTVLFVNYNGSLARLDITDVKMDVSYLSVCDDDSHIVGVFTTNSEYCITAKESGLIEIWDLHCGVPISDYTVEDRLNCMEGCPCCSVILISGCSSYLYAIDFSDVKNLKCIHISRPSEEAIKIIKCDPYGRFAILVSSDPFIFIYSIVPSKGFKILGYISVQYNIKDLTLFSQGNQDIIFLTLLGKTDSNDCILHIEIPGNFDINHTKYWKDNSGMISTGLIKVLDINLKMKHCSLAVHHSKGLILCLPTRHEFINVPFESIKTFSVESDEEKYEELNDFEECRMFLSSSHSRLFTISESGSILVRNTENFSILSTHNLSSYSRVVSCCAFSENLVFIEVCKGVLACLKLPDIPKVEKMPWESFCETEKEEEDRDLASMKVVTKEEMLSFIKEQLKILNESKIKELKEKRNALEDEFNRLSKRLNVLVEENFSVPLEYQIKSEDFVLSDSVREQMIESRSEDIANYKKEMEEKIAKIEKNIYDIKKECLDDMYAKGKVFRSFKEESTLYNYSIRSMSEREKSEICHSYKKSLLEVCLEKVKLKENVELEDFEKELSFETFVENEVKEDIGKDMKKQPFQLQSREERIDYVFTLKYIIFRKRQAFNNLFDVVEDLRRRNVESIQNNNSRIKEILQLIKEDKTVWEPTSIDNDSVLEVDEEEIENARRMLLEESSNEPKGIAEEFLKDEWLIKLKATSTQKFQLRLKKDNIDLLKKEMEKKFRLNDALVKDYERAHAKLIEEKLRWDLEISQDELQIFLILFSVANSSSYKNWEFYNRRIIEDLESECKFHNDQLSQLEKAISYHKKEISKLGKESDSLDNEAQKISKVSRNKQSFLDAFKKRPSIPEDEEGILNPYKAKKAKPCVPKDLFQEMNASKSKPPKVPLALWKQLCALREQTFSIEIDIDEKNHKVDILRNHVKKLNDIQKILKQEIKKRKDKLQEMHEKRIRCNFETPMVHPISYAQLQIKYPDDLDFKESLFFQRYHMEGLNNMISNAGSDKLWAVEAMSKTRYEIEKNEARYRIDKLKMRDASKEIELSKRIPLTKDIQKIIQQPKGFSITDKIDAFEKSKQNEISEIRKQMTHTTERISNIEVKKDILKRSMKEKKREIEKLKGDIAELRKIESLKTSKLK